MFFFYILLDKNYLFYEMINHRNIKIHVLTLQNVDKTTGLEKRVTEVDERSRQLKLIIHSDT